MSHCCRNANTARSSPETSRFIAIAHQIKHKRLTNNNNTTTTTTTTTHQHHHNHRQNNHIIIIIVFTTITTSNIPWLTFIYWTILGKDICAKFVLLFEETILSCSYYFCGFTLSFSAFLYFRLFLLFSYQLLCPRSILYIFLPGGHERPFLSYVFCVFIKFVFNLFEG